MLTIKDGNLIAGHPYVWADWGLHIALAANFAFRPIHLWFVSLPVYAGVPLNYPFASDLISGLLWRGGASLVSSFFLPSLFTTVLFTVGLYAFFRKLLKSEIASILSSYLFVFSGGLGILFGLRQFDPHGFMTQIHASGIEFTTIVMGMLVPQRPFLLGIPFALFVIYTLFLLYSKKNISNYRFSIAGVIAGVMPLIHTHSFLVVVFFSIWFFVQSLQKLKSWFWYGIPAVFVSMCVYVLFLHPISGLAPFFSFHIGWLTQTSLFDWFIFWIKNWGIFPFVALVGTISMFGSYKKLFWFVMGWWMVFVIANLIQFQPQTWDNSKIFAYAYLGLCIPVGYLFSKILLRKNMAEILIVLLLFFTMTVSGGVDVIRMLDFSHYSYQMLSAQEIEMGTFIRTRTSSDSNFLTSDAVDNQVSMIGGRSVLLGYPGWAFNYGLSYQQRQSDIRAMYSGASNTASLLQLYNVRYVLIGPNEEQYSPNLSYFSQYPIVYQSSAGTLYKVR